LRRLNERLEVLRHRHRRYCADHRAGRRAGGLAVQQVPDGVRQDFKGVIMKVKQVNRYYCDYCAKSRGTKHSMEVHEKHCTMNPNRQCRMCKSGNVPELLRLMPNPDLFFDVDDGMGGFKNYQTDMQAGLQNVLDATEGCPACTLAVLRQSYTRFLVEWNYEEACKEWWDAVNDAGQQRSYWG
jgi:hypothetical protein